MLGPAKGRLIEFELREYQSDDAGSWIVRGTRQQIYEEKKAPGEWGNEWTKLNMHRRRRANDRAKTVLVWMKGGVKMWWREKGEREE